MPDVRTHGVATSTSVGDWPLQNWRLSRINYTGNRERRLATAVGNSRHQSSVGPPYIGTSLKNYLNNETTKHKLLDNEDMPGRQHSTTGETICLSSYYIFICHIMSLSIISH
ncbi:hypothetical protein PoB_001997700 [Plakobranchus ocellatus]|uniref:Uncharacterized protein n=1 Tax=Plakobranchus ocellatus TaxID=259542 RepID=A0AAV3ZG15_9GAST|nr:hypothetical protein PoB_001997700 [Plakobranchus ocellatus]